MKRWILALLLGLTPFVWAQTPTRQEVVLEARGSAKLGVALATPQVNGVNTAVVDKDFVGVVNRDLEEAGPFAVIRNGLPRTTDPASFKAWADTGTEWLVVTALSRRGEDRLEVSLKVLDVKSGKQVFTKPYSGPNAALRRIAHSVADELVAHLTGEPGVASTRVVFVRQTAPEGIKEIFQVDRDGSNIVQLTRHGSLTLSATVAPDGRLAYVTYKGGTPEIWGQRSIGGPHIKLYPQGAKVEGHCFSPAWSPDGKRLAFVQGDRRGNSDIVLLTVESGRVRRITDSNCINTEPCWNPAGTQIAFTSDREGSPQVYLMEDDGSNVRRLTHEGHYNASPAWSPSGAMIAYVSRFEGKFDLFVYKLGEGKSYQITTGVASSESPSWSPDERRLVFTSTRGSGMQIYTTDLSGNQVRRLMDITGCQSPKWTRSR